MDKQKAGWSDWWHFFQILVNSEWIVIMLSDYSTYLIMSHHLTLIHTLQQLMNSTKLFLQSFNFSFASPEQNRCAIYLRFQKKILSFECSMLAIFSGSFWCAMNRNMTNSEPWPYLDSLSVIVVVALSTFSLSPALMWFSS